MTPTFSDLGNGASEIGIRDASGDLVAVITHPGTRCPWFLHRGTAKAERFTTKKSALAAAGVEG